MLANRRLFATMLAFGIFGFLAAFVLSVEKYHLLADPNAALSCSFNLVLNCASVMTTWQASLFGFPNSLIGVAAYPVVIVIAVLGLVRAQLPRWFWLGTQAGYVLGAIFAYWLFFQSVYVIQVLCPWCLVVTFSTTILLATLTHRNLRAGVFGLSKSTSASLNAFLDRGYGTMLTAAWIVLLVGLVIVKFGDALLG